jgi:hypothetical protein
VICGAPGRGLLTALALWCATAGADEPRLATKGSLAYACGGVGADERRALRALEPHANLKLLFVTARRGGYLAGAEVVVRDGSGRQVDLVAEGPICLLVLPAGAYRISATLGGVVRSAQLSVSAPSGKPQPIAFSYPGEVWDGIWASPEEKQQARE